MHLILVCLSFKFKAITEQMTGADDPSVTQLFVLSTAVYLLFLLRSINEQQCPRIHCYAIPSSKSFWPASTPLQVHLVDEWIYDRIHSMTITSFFLFCIGYIDFIVFIVGDCNRVSVDDSSTVWCMVFS